MYILIPGRHHLLTQFQHSYLQGLIQKGLSAAAGVDGKPLGIPQPVTALVYAVTSANHSNTRRNPLPFYLRALSIHAMTDDLAVPTYIYGIEDVGQLPHFAQFTLKRIAHESEGRLKLTPENTLVLCSTPVLRMYEEMGYRILPAELADVGTWRYHAPLPWEVVEKLNAAKTHTEARDAEKLMHPDALVVWQRYGLAAKVRSLFADAMISADGDITTTRDYNVYVRQMDDIADLKYQETKPYLRPGRIGDIGCAVGSWIRLACAEPKLAESDFYGIEVSRPLYEICRQRKENGAFANPNVFFSQRNAVTGLAFEAGSMNTIHTSSLTHEIESYGSRQELLQFIANRFAELAPGGVWVNRDVVGPPDKEATVLMQLNKKDGKNKLTAAKIKDPKKFSLYLQGLSTYGRFLQFAKDFRKAEGYKLKYNPVKVKGKEYIKLRLADACEFMSRKDYTDNWLSEMHETFCFWDYAEWQAALEAAGFRLLPESRAYVNEWLVKNRLKGKLSLYTETEKGIKPLPYPISHMLLLAEKL